MQLSDFPSAIATSQTDLLLRQQLVRTLQTNVDRLNAEIDETIAFDATLTNDVKRKSIKVTLMGEAAYQAAWAQLQAAQDERDRRQIQVELLRNQFAVAKLEWQMVISQAELQAA